MAAKRNLKRKNRKIKFSEKNYIQKYYMSKGKAVIPVELKSLDELYMKHDYKKMELANSVCDYIEEIAFMVPVNTDIVIEIHMPEIDEETQAKVKKDIKNNYGMEIDENDTDLSTLNRRAGSFTVLGILILIVYLLIEEHTKLLANFVSVVWWVAIWDMIEILLLDKKEIKLKRLNNQQLYDSQIVFDFGNDDKKEEKEVKDSKENSKEK